jgi:hypothetical protein
LVAVIDWYSRKVHPQSQLRACFIISRGNTVNLNYIQLTVIAGNNW